MAKFRVWYGDEPTYKKVSSLTEAIKFIKKKPDFDESNSGIEEKIDNDYWDEWLDEDDQNVHEHLYMYGGKSKYLKSLDDEDEDEDLDEDEEVEDEEVEDDEEDAVEEDLDDRLMDVIGGGRRAATEVEEAFEDGDDDLEDDEDDDLDDLEEDDDL